MLTRIAIADDQEMVRHGMRLILDNQPDFSVIGEAADGVTAVELVRETHPDVLLLDIRMPFMDGIEVIRKLSNDETTRDVKIVVVTTFDLDEYVYPALQHGATGFILKRTGPGLLVEAVRAAVNGDSLISPSITVRLLKQVIKQDPKRPQLPDGLLTERESEIAAMIAEGMTNNDIAAELFISPGTVKTHLASIQRKLGVRNRVGIAVLALEHGYTRERPR